jgi:hypothetical protein
MPRNKGSRSKARKTKPQNQRSEESQALRDEDFFSEDDQGPYYTLGENKNMWVLWEIAKRLRQIEEVREAYLVGQTSASLEDALEIERIRSEQASQFAQPSLMRDIAIQISEGNFKALAKIATALKAAKDGVESLSLEKAACVWTMVACDLIWETGRITSGVAWDEVQKVALRLWRLDMARREKGYTPEQLKKLKVAFTPGKKGVTERSINWQRIRKKLGIKLKTATAGRPTKAEVEARKRNLKEAELGVEYTK